MRPASFAEYASSSSLTEDEIYTVKLLIEAVKHELGECYYESWMERSEARQQPDYVPSFPLDLVEAAGLALYRVSSLFLPTRYRDLRRIRDITAFSWFPNLTSLCLSGHEIADIGPLVYCVMLETLELPVHPVQDLSPLKECRHLKNLTLPGGSFPDLSALTLCQDLEKLHIRGKVEDLSLLEFLPKLRHLTLDTDSLPAFRKLAELPALVELHMACSECFDSFVGFPALPALRVISGACVSDLRGIQKFPSLRNLMALYGTFDSLEALWALKRLTHLEIHESGLRSLETVSRIYALRHFEIRSETPDLDLEVLKTLPALHYVQLWLPDAYRAEIGKLKEELSSWDTEFFSPAARHTPSLEIHVLRGQSGVQGKAAEGVGLTASDDNPELLRSEMNWLRRKLDEMLAGEFGDVGRNCDHGNGWRPSRSLSAGMDDDRLLECLPRLVLEIQRVLIHAIHDWVIDLLSEAGDREEWFTIWIHPDKVVVSEEHAGRVGRLLASR